MQKILFFLFNLSISFLPESIEQITIWEFKSGITPPEHVVTVILFLKK